MSTLTLESVISDEIISEFSQKASKSVIWPDCSTWLNEQRTFKELRGYAPSWFSLLVLHTSDQDLVELASQDHSQDIRGSVAKNRNTPRYVLEMLARGASEWVKEAALANPKMAGFYVSEPGAPSKMPPEPESGIEAEAPLLAA
jgi:hypothetical protein